MSHKMSHKMHSTACACEYVASATKNTRFPAISVEIACHVIHVIAIARVTTPKNQMPFLDNIQSGQSLLMIVYGCVCVPLIDPLDGVEAATDDDPVDVLLVWTFVCTDDMLWGSNFDVTELHMSNILDVYMTTRHQQRISTPSATRRNRTAPGRRTSTGTAGFAKFACVRAVDGAGVCGVVAGAASSFDTGEPTRTKRKERKYTAVVVRTTHR